MFRVESDPKQRLMTMTFAQRVVPEELKKNEARVQELLSGLQPGFRLLSDLSKLETMDPACLADVKANMDLLNQHGISVVVRVIPDPHKDIGFNILSLFHYRRGVRIVTCETLAEALAALAD